MTIKERSLWSMTFKIPRKKRRSRLRNGRSRLKMKKKEEKTGVHGTIPPSRTKNPFQTMIHQYPVQKIPPSSLPSAWDFDRTNNVGDYEFKEEEWGGKTSSWDSPHDILMNHVEHNAQLVNDLSYKVDELMELVKKLIKDSSPPPKK